MTTRPAIDIYSPDIYVDGPPHELFSELRRTQPVFWQDMPDEPGYWAVLKHADVMRVSKNPRLFSASEGGVVLENLEPAQLEMMRHMLLAMDPPRHSAVRRPIAPHFQARVIADLEERIRGICREVLERAGDTGDVEFVHDVTSGLPSQVIGELMGLPREDWSRIHEMAERITNAQDPDVSGGDPRMAATASVDMAMYAIDFAAKRRERSRGDLTDVILGMEIDGTPVSDVDFGTLFVQLVTAANDTTKTMLSSGLLALLEHPDQMAALSSDPALVPGAIEEILRWANPLHYFRRTVTADTELRGVAIRKGEKVAMYYTSANRDEDVFEDPDRFDIRRHPNPHLSFGFAEHFCLGAHLARLEGKVFFEELLAAFPLIELTGEPRRTRSNLNNSLKSLPVRLST